MYKTKKELTDHLEELGYEPCTGGYYYPGTYICSHGEYERPTYSPRHYKGGWDVHIEYFYYAGTYYAPRSGRASDDFWVNE